MKKAILCAKKSGNTYDICKYVSDKSNCDLIAINENVNISLDKYDTVILASGVYANHTHKNITRWIETLQPSQNNKLPKFYMFLTWVGRGHSDKSAFNEVKDLLKTKNIHLQDDYMKCFGKSFGFVRKSHPNEDDKQEVLSWVQKL